MNRVDEYWSWFFGVDLDVYRAGSTDIVAHCHPDLEEYNGAWVFNHGGKYVISVPQALIEATHDRSARWTGDLQSTEAVAFVFGDLVSRIIGPAFQGYAEYADFRPGRLHPTRRLEKSDTPALEHLLGCCDQKESAHSSIALDDHMLYGCIVDNRLVAVATGIRVGPWTVSPGVLTHPDFRGRGYGRSAAGALMRDVLEQGDMVVYQTLMSNEPALKLGKSLGVRDYATHVAVRFVPA